MKLKFATAILAVSLAHAASAGCAAPDEPALPSETAVLAEMVKAAKDVKQYLADANKYLGCVRNALSADKVEARMHVVADNFNALTTSYKARTAVATN